MLRSTYLKAHRTLPMRNLINAYSTEARTATITHSDNILSNQSVRTAGTTKDSGTIRNVKSASLLNVEVGSTSLETVSSFDDIPGPISLRLISKFWSYVPIVSSEFTAGALFHVLNLGKFFGNILSWGGNAKFFQKFFNVYGPIVRLHGPFGGDVLLLSRPEHARIVFEKEGLYPVRSCLDSIEKYRIEYRRFRHAGPFLTSGAEWDKLHRSLEQPIQNLVNQHYDKIDRACDDFVERILAIRNLQEEVPKNFKDEILKWCLECTFSVTLNTKLGFLDRSGLSSISDLGRLIDGINGATTAIRKCEYGFHVWKFMETPAWKSLVKNCDIIDGILNKYIITAQNTIREKKDLNKFSPNNISLVEILLLKEDILAEDVMTVLLDMLLIGANATAHTVAFLLYHMAKFPRTQIKLHEEIKKVSGDITKEKLKEMPYLQACIKESLRLKPPIPILNRILSQNAVIYNYQIPKGTYVLMATHLASLREEYFEDANKFYPERWLAHEQSTNEHQGFASIPFGYGPKACLARELAEVQVGLLLVKVLKKFRIEYNYGDIPSSNELLAAPTKSLNFRFIDRV